MAPFAFSLATFGGICFATGVFHLFICLRCQGINMEQFKVNLFAMACSDSAVACLHICGITLQPQYPVVDGRVACPRDTLS